MAEDYRRHDIPDGTWEMLRPHLKGRKGTWGGNARDNRRFMNGVLWVLRTGAPWRDLPPCHGDWKNTHRRFCRWRDAGEWEGLPEILIQDADYEWLMMDATHVKVHRDGGGARGGGQGIGRTKGGPAQRYIRPWIRMVCRSESLSRLATSLTARRLAGLLGA